MLSKREILTLLSKDEFLLTMLTEQIGEHVVAIEREGDHDVTYEEIGRDAVAGVLKWPLDDGFEGPADLSHLTFTISVDDSIKAHFDEMAEGLHESVQALRVSFELMSLTQRLKFLFLGRRYFE